MTTELRPPEIVILPDRAALAREAATRFVALAREAIAARTRSHALSGAEGEVEGRFTVALSGGSTPRDLYALLASPDAQCAAQIDWARVHFFWGDERAVPPDHPDSNYRMAYEVLLSRVQPPAQNVHRIPAELPPADAARAYEQMLREFFALDVSLRAAKRRGNPQDSVDASAASSHPSTRSARSGSLLAMTEPRTSASNRVPDFDLILLGLGANGHTASLFPHTSVLHETTRWVAAAYIDEVKMWRITLTAPVINAAANILWLVAGADKAATVRAVLRGAYRPDDLPAQLIQPTNGRAAWLLDREAAGQIS